MSEQCRVKLTAGRVKSQGGVVGIEDVRGEYVQEKMSGSHRDQLRNSADGLIDG